MKSPSDFEPRRMAPFAFGFVLYLLLTCSPGSAQVQASSQPELNDVHFHLTNYIQEGTDIHEFLNIMGTKVGHVAIFGIPLQQEWPHDVDGDNAPTYCVNSDAPLSSYSFPDAFT